MSDEAKHCTVTVTFDAQADAAAMAKILVGERLAACAQVDGPITSTFWWEGEVQAETEWRMELKTRTDILDVVVARVRELHSYDVPQITAAPIIGGLVDYLDWIDTETQQDDQPTRQPGAAATDTSVAAG